MRSTSSPRAVSISTGTRDDSRSARSTSRPERFGSITSSTTIVCSPERARVRPVSPSCATSISKPSDER